MSVECVAIFWVVNASSGEKSCLQFSIQTGSGAGGEGGVSHSLNEPTDRQNNQELRKNRPKNGRHIFPSDRLFIFSLTDGKPALLKVGRF